MSSIGNYTFLYKLHRYKSIYYDKYTFHINNSPYVYVYRIGIHMVNYLYGMYIVYAAKLLGQEN